MDITATITGIKYTSFLLADLEEINIEELVNFNDTPSSFVLKDNKSIFAISKWVSPKRTRSYPYERVYNTLWHSKKITVIPIIKDEGLEGDRDYIQWDTISLMSLLDVYVIIAYYDDAEVNPRNKYKITNQQFNSKFIISKIKEIEQYHSSALHWNLNEVNNIHQIIDCAKISYSKIEKETGVKLHNFDGIDNFKKKIGDDVSLFMQFSRHKSQEAQTREINTIQPKENLSSDSKTKITITNYLGGQYFLTIDELEKEDNKMYLIESKHSKNELLPSIGDIKDGLLKMLLFSNLQNITDDKIEIKYEPVLKLTSALLVGKINSNSQEKEYNAFVNNNNFSIKQKSIIENLFKEANENSFLLKIAGLL